MIRNGGTRLIFQLVSGTVIYLIRIFSGKQVATAGKLFYPLIFLISKKKNFFYFKRHFKEDVIVFYVCMIIFKFGKCPLSNLNNSWNSCFKKSNPFFQSILLLNCIVNSLFWKALKMNNSNCSKKKKRGVSVLYFLAVTILTTAAVVLTIKEGNRIKVENELLSYEVWWNY